MQSSTEPKTRKSENRPKTRTEGDDPVLGSLLGLKTQLAHLEQEQQAIRAELTKKRKNRARRLQEIRDTRARNLASLDRMKAGLAESQSLTRKQKDYLKLMRKVQKQNEESLNRIARRLDGLETLLQEGALPVDQLRSELLNMLGDLHQMRERRQKVETLVSSP